MLEFLSLLCALWLSASQFSSFPLLNKLIQFKLRVVTHTSLGFRPQKVGNLTHSMSLNSLWRLKVMSAVYVACPVLSLFCACLFCACLFTAGVIDMGRVVQNWFQGNPGFVRNVNLEMKASKANSV